MRRNSASWAINRGARGGERHLFAGSPLEDGGGGALRAACWAVQRGPISHEHGAASAPPLAMVALLTCVRHYSTPLSARCAKEYQYSGSSPHIQTHSISFASSDFAGEGVRRDSASWAINRGARGGERHLFAGSPLEDGGGGALRAACWAVQRGPISHEHGAAAAPPLAMVALLTCVRHYSTPLSARCAKEYQYSGSSPHIQTHSISFASSDFAGEGVRRDSASWAINRGARGWERHLFAGSPLEDGGGGALRAACWAVQRGPISHEHGAAAAPPLAMVALLTCVRHYSTPLSARCAKEYQYSDSSPHIQTHSISFASSDFAGEGVRRDSASWAISRRAPGGERHLLAGSPLEDGGGGVLRAACWAVQRWPISHEHGAAAAPPLAMVALLTCVRHYSTPLSVSMR